MENQISLAIVRRRRRRTKFKGPVIRGILAQAVSCSNVHGVFPVHKLFWFCLVQVSTAHSSGSGSARSWKVLGHGDGSTAPGSHGQGSSDDSRNTRRRLDTFSSPEDEHARSAVLLRFPCEQYHTGITNWINNLWQKSSIPTYNKPVRIHCKACSVSARLVFETRAKCQDFVARYRDDGIPCEIDSPFCNAKPVISVRQSKSIEVREIGKQFAPLWEVLAEQLKILFPEGDGGGAFIVPALDARSQVLSIRIRETALENHCFLEADSCLLLLQLTCVFLVKCCRK